MSDEIYRAISYDGEATSLLSVAEGLDRLVVVDGVAKSFAMTGWRIGWSIAPRDLRAHDDGAAVAHHVECGDAFPARGAGRALESECAADAAVAAMVQEFERRRDAALRLLRDASV